LNNRLNRDTLRDLDKRIRFFRQAFGHIAQDDNMFWAIFTKSLYCFAEIDYIQVIRIGFGKFRRIIVNPSDLRLYIANFMRNRLIL